MSGPSDDRDMPPPPAQPPPPQAQPGAEQCPGPGSRSATCICRHAAAARTGYVTPGQAADHEQATGSVGGTLSAARPWRHHRRRQPCAGAGALIGAGAGLIAGTAIGSDNAQHAAGRCPAGLCRCLLCLHGRQWRPAAGMAATLMVRRVRRLRAITAPYPLSLSLPLSYPAPIITGRRSRLASAGGSRRVASLALTPAAAHFDMGRPGLYGPAVFISDRHAAQSQSRQAQSPATAHPDPAAGDGALSRGQPGAKPTVMSPSPNFPTPMATISISATPPSPAATPPDLRMKRCGTRWPARA